MRFLKFLKCQLFHKDFHFSCFPDEFSLLEENDCEKCGMKWTKGILFIKVINWGRDENIKTN